MDPKLFGLKAELAPDDVCEYAGMAAQPCDFRWQQLQEALSKVDPSGVFDGRQAAVAILLRSTERGPWPEVLLMRRAMREGDRWSGQVSLPGGHIEKTDANRCSAAIRETEEEVGVELAKCARLLGRLSSFQATPAGPKGLTTVHPFVFKQDVEPVLRLGPEADRAFWLPLSLVRSGDLDWSHEIEYKGQSLKMPAWRYEEEIVWGLTHRIISALLALFA